MIVDYFYFWLFLLVYRVFKNDSPPSPGGYINRIELGAISIQDSPDYLDLPVSHKAIDRGWIRHENEWIWARWIALETDFKLKPSSMLRLLFKMFTNILRPHPKTTDIYFLNRRKGDIFRFLTAIDQKLSINQSNNSGSIPKLQMYGKQVFELEKNRKRDICRFGPVIDEKSVN